MATPLELTRYIRYQLSELGARNAHHEFEHLARYLARARVSSNILPATGPVSAGGDGGRDFETFKTHNELPLTPDSSFHRLASGERQISFACSIQKDVVPKIKNEVKRVNSIGKYKEMVFFCEENLPVARRHTQEKDAEALGINLQIFDGAAIAEMLSDRDTFWIAQSYLQIPSNMMPESENSPDWYQELVSAWRDKEPLPFSHSDFYDLKLGIRRATSNESARHDLKMWVDKLQTYRTAQASRELQRWACYEIIVASFRGTGSFEGLDTIAHDYFSDLAIHVGTGDLADAVNLRNYLIGAEGLNVYPDTAPSLYDIEHQLAVILEKERVSAPGPGRRADLLRLLGMVHLSILKDEKYDLEAVAGYWDQMLDEAAQAKFFLIQEFNEYYLKLLPMLENPPELAELAPRIDDLVATSSGSREVGGNAEKRGDNYFAQNDVIGALKEYQRARKRLHEGGDDFALIRVVLKMADCFRSLGLTYSGKHYALSAAWMLGNPSRPVLRKRLPYALHSVSEMEYASGNFVGFAHYTYLARAAELSHGSVQAPSPIAENIGHIYGLLGTLRRKSPKHFENLKPGFSDWPVEIFGDLFAISSGPGIWDEGSVESITSEMGAMLVDRPWGDVVKTREVRWTAMGIEWRCTFNNDYTTVVAAEILISQIQFALCAMAVEKTDLLLIPTNLHLALSVESKKNSGGIKAADFDGKEWQLRISLPQKSKIPNLEKNQFWALITQIIGTVSLLNTQDYISRSHNWFKSFVEIGFSFRPYEELHFEFTPEGTFIDRIKLSNEAPFKFTGIGSTFKCLPAFSGIAPNYNKIKQLERISDRYAAGIPNLQYTAQNLLKSSQAYKFFKSLHSDGIKDWYLLCIISGMAINVRGAKLLRNKITPKIANQLHAISLKVEAPESALSETDFDMNHLPFFETGFLPLLMASLDLSPDHDLINDPKTLEVIKDRFNIRVDDVDHPEIFVWE